MRSASTKNSFSTPSWIIIIIQAVFNSITVYINPCNIGLHKSLSIPCSSPKQLRQILYAILFHLTSTCCWDEVILQTICNLEIIFFDTIKKWSLVLQSIKHLHSYPDFSFQDEDLITYLTHAEMHIACAFKMTLMTGCNIVHMARPTNWRPIVPPGKKLTRYHSSATIWTPKSVRKWIFAKARCLETKKKGGIRISYEWFKSKSITDFRWFVPSQAELDPTQLTGCYHDVSVSLESSFGTREIQRPHHASHIYYSKRHSFHGQHATEVFVRAFHDSKAPHEGDRPTGETKRKFSGVQGQHGNTHKDSQGEKEGRQEQKRAKDLFKNNIVVAEKELLIVEQKWLVSETVFGTRPVNCFRFNSFEIQSYLFTLKRCW